MTYTGVPLPDELLKLGLEVGTGADIQVALHRDDHNVSLLSTALKTGANPGCRRIHKIYATLIEYITIVS
jgi:hypothetical protein